MNEDEYQKVYEAWSESAEGLRVRLDRRRATLKRMEASDMPDIILTEQRRLVREVEGKLSHMDHSECVAAGEGNARGHTHEGETGWWIWPDEVGKGLYDDSPTGAFGP